MKMNRHHISKWEIMRIVLLTVICAVIILPFVWMILNSFKSADEVLDKNIIFPTAWHPENYVLAWNAAPFDIYFKNSILMALATVVGQIITSSMAAYSFAKLKYRLNKPLFMIFLSSMMVPSEATIVSNYLTISGMGLINTFFSVIAPSIVSVFGVFLLRQFYMTIPDALMEAARIDGAGEVKVFTSVILPLGKSAMATIAIMGFIASWNSYLWPLIITSSMELRTVQTGLRAMIDNDLGPTWEQLMAMATLVIVPVLILFVCLQKYFVQGITKVGLK
ncbi:MAG: carbohydrate ABC transporter permease [bacterium]|nr:carbohydrate ABC transporter permease [bacterium]